MLNYIYHYIIAHPPPPPKADDGLLKAGSNPVPRGRCGGEPSFGWPTSAFHAQHSVYYLAGSNVNTVMMHLVTQLSILFCTI